MDEIEQRLRESTDACIKSYESWRSKEKDGAAREALQEAVHELRKVASRLEIEMAVSERNEMAGKPLPIPPHRSSRRPRPNGEHDDGDDNAGNVDPQAPSAADQNRARMQNRPRRPQQGGGGRQGE
jgi:hypothetical protein